MVKGNRLFLVYFYPFCLPISSRTVHSLWITIIHSLMLSTMEGVPERCSPEKKLLWKLHSTMKSERKLSLHGYNLFKVFVFQNKNWFHFYPKPYRKLRISKAYEGKHRITVETVLLHPGLMATYCCGLLFLTKLWFVCLFLYFFQEVIYIAELMYIETDLL